MNVLAVTGSPRPESFSASLTEEFLRGARDAGHQTKLYRLNDLSFKGCQACGACKREPTDCVYEDDLRPYWHDLHEADALALSAPIYAGNVCGPMISFMNRHYCLLDADWNVRLHPGVRLFGFFSQGREDTSAYLNKYREYLADFENRKMVLEDILIVSARGGAENLAVVKKKAYQLGNSLE